MAQYFFSVSKSERQNILDQHKSLYDGYVTLQNNPSNLTPLYVQDFANDKVGITVNNQGVVKPYTNMGINESHTGFDMIGGDPNSQSKMKYRHLKNGTVDIDSLSDTMSDNIELMHNTYPSPNEDEVDYISLGNTDDDFGFESPSCKSCEGTGCEECDGSGMKRNPIGFDVDVDFDNEDLNYFTSTEDNDPEESFELNFKEVDDDDLPEFMDKLHESLDMFQRFKMYN
jgi:hypothetical protein